MSTYGLLEHFGETNDPELLKRHKALNDGSNYVAKNVFADQRLDKLWSKAETAGFTRKFSSQYIFDLFHTLNIV